MSIGRIEQPCLAPMLTGPSFSRRNRDPRTGVRLHFEPLGQLRASEHIRAHFECPCRLRTCRTATHAPARRTRAEPGQQAGAPVVRQERLCLTSWNTAEFSCRLCPVHPGLLSACNVACPMFGHEHLRANHPRRVANRPRARVDLEGLITQSRFSPPPHHHQIGRCRCGARPEPHSVRPRRRSSVTCSFVQYAGPVRVCYRLSVTSR